MAVWWERWYPLAIAAAATLLAMLVPAISQVAAAPSKDVVSAGINMAAIFVGFIAAVASILMSVSSAAVRFMKRTGKFKTLVEFMWSAIRASLLYLGVSILMLLFDGQTAIHLPTPWTGYMWLFLGVWSIMTAQRATRISMILIRNSADED